MGLAIEVIERGLICQIAELKGEQAGETLSLEAPPVLTQIPSCDLLLSSEPIPFPTFSILAEDLSLERQGVLDLNEAKPKQALGGILFSFVKPNAASVLIAGDFNRWIAEPMLLVDQTLSLWQKVIPINSGTYHYKFLADDAWLTDPFNQLTEPNPHGGFDSVITVDHFPPTYENRQETKTGTC
ncbi:MAG: hypothetical protein HY351_03940 [Candidatus Omnitrophica bacterium]|nr:hypothetical protein [Candidatus Omnitrophota bacterium]